MNKMWIEMNQQSFFFLRFYFKYIHTINERLGCIVMIYYTKISSEKCIFFTNIRFYCLTSYALAYSYVCYTDKIIFICVTHKVYYNIMFHNNNSDVLTKWCTLFQKP